MKLIKEITQFIIFSQETIINALQKINKSKIIFIVDRSGVVEGTVTDGDFRRWLLKQEEIDLNQPISLIQNKSFKYSYMDSDTKSIEALFDSGISHIPLLNKSGRIVSIAKKGDQDFQIDEKIIGDNSPVFIIAEIGNNHNGDIKLAKKLVDSAISAGADCAKFQMRDMEDLYGKSGIEANKGEDLGAEYTLDLLNRFQLSIDEMFEIFDYCKKNKIRTANIPEPIKVNKEENFSLKIENVNWLDFYKHVKEGQIVYADDSTLKFHIEKITKNEIVFYSLSNGFLKNGKGLHIRGMHSEIPFLFQKDLELIDSANQLEIDFVGLSFVRNDNDINQVKKLLDNKISLLPKVETLSAVQNIDEILENNEQILVDRGDLSADVGIGMVPIFQNYILQKANFSGKEVFLATQFLKSMELKPLPTIAEINDLYNTFILSSVCGIQLSEETAVGKYPQECLDIVGLIIDQISEKKSINNIMYELAKLC